jgi:hypothetical protein
MKAGARRRRILSKNKRIQSAQKGSSEADPRTRCGEYRLKWWSISKECKPVSVAEEIPAGDAFKSENKKQFSCHFRSKESATMQVNSKIDSNIEQQCRMIQEQQFEAITAM